MQFAEVLNPGCIDLEGHHYQAGSMYHKTHVLHISGWHRC